MDDYTQQLANLNETLDAVAFETNRVANALERIAEAWGKDVNQLKTKI